MLTPSGPVCDICGEYILAEAFDEFRLKGIKQTMFAHSKCGNVLQTCGSDWRKLPEGPLRKGFEKANEEGMCDETEA